MCVHVCVLHASHGSERSGSPLAVHTHITIAVCGVRGGVVHTHPHGPKAPCSHDLSHFLAAGMDHIPTVLRRDDLSIPTAQQRLHTIRSAAQRSPTKPNATQNMSLVAWWEARTTDGFELAIATEP